MQRRLFACLVVLVVLLFRPAFVRAFSVAILVPDDDVEDMFWSAFVSCADAAAKDLDIDLRVYWAGQRFAYTERLKEVVAGKDRADYLMLFYYRRSGKSAFDVADAAGIPFFLVNSDILAEEREAIGLPREKYPLWLGHMSPDDEQAGYLLAKALVAKARQAGLAAPDGRVHLIGISGRKSSSPTFYRNNGLARAVQDAGDAVVERLVFADWDEEEAYKKTRHLAGVYKQASVVWAASDTMAFGAVRALRDAGREPGSGVLVGGVDWSKTGVEGVREGWMGATVGGHILEGAWALVLLHDYHHGRDFADQGVVFRSPMHVVDQSKPRFLEFVRASQWEQIDFKQFSRVYSSKDGYEFSLEEVLGQAP